MLLWLSVLAPAVAQAACSDKTLRGMSDAGRSVATIAKRCGMSAAAVKERLGAGETKSNRAPPEAAAPAAAGAADAASAASATNATKTAKPAKAPADPPKHPPGTILELCGCYGTMEYGFTEPNAQCVSGKAVATRCPGYCPVNRSPWRRICS
ncbi:hypothetical protein [Achromobacter mucicolens]|uniref:hypothetical protein n=1 Tax=Achromobacter mucicolens TaxID=1389922 RepID=UPI001CBC3C85|nr:hypothetical protein [Achromobacter mucicolens]UAN03713.1 hypothetical protein K9D24_06045 [Achromobacter mucicolens]